jgi:hypothetical protein
MGKIGYRGLSVTAGGIRKVADAVERLALTPANGDFVIQLDNDSLYYYNGATWEIYLDDSSYDDLLQVIADLAAHLADTVDAHDASAISVVAGSGISATNVQTALLEHQIDIDNLNANVAQVVSDLDDHITDALDAHDASAISFNNVASGLTATDVQDAIDELEGRVEDAETDIVALDARIDTLEALPRAYVVVANTAQANGATFDPADNRRQIQQISGNAGANVLADLGITNAEEGDELVLLGTDSTNTIGLINATNTVLNGSVTLGLDDSIKLFFANGKWREESRNA